MKPTTPIPQRLQLAQLRARVVRLERLVVQLIRLGGQQGRAKAA